MKSAFSLPPSLPWSALAVALSVGALSLSFARPALPQERNLRTLTVTGQGKEMVTTTLAQVRLGVEAQGKTANAVQEEVARRSNSVVSLLKNRQVEKLETTGINLQPNYRYDDGKQTLIGYIGSNIVSFRVATEKAGPIMDEAVKAGASRIDGISFVATDAAIATAQKAALRDATREAQEQAETVLSALNLTRKDIVGIQIGNAVVPPPRPYEAADLNLQKAAAAPMPVIGGEQQVNASVTLQISY